MVDFCFVYIFCSGCVVLVCCNSDMVIGFGSLFGLIVLVFVSVMRLLLMFGCLIMNGVVRNVGVVSEIV